MDNYNRPASPGLYMVWGAAAVIGFVMIYGLAGVVIDWMSASSEPTAITAPVN
jgi:hypothetical protein